MYGGNKLHGKFKLFLSGLPWVWGFPWGFPWVWVWYGYGDCEMLKCFKHFAHILNVFTCKVTVEVLEHRTFAEHS